MKKHKLTIKNISKILGDLAPITIRRLAKSDKIFPAIETIGRSRFVDNEAFYEWLSKKAGFKVTPPDKAITSKQLQEMLDKSHTWIWLNVKNKTLPRPFKIGRLNFWMLSQFGGLKK